MTPDQSYHTSVQYTVQTITSFQHSFLTLLSYAYFTFITPSTHFARCITLNLKTASSIFYRCLYFPVI